jgi:hypothetical protein
LRLRGFAEEEWPGKNGVATKPRVLTNRPPWIGGSLIVGVCKKDFSHSLDLRVLRFDEIGTDIFNVSGVAFAGKAFCH